MAKCSKCRGDNCENCGGPVVCTSHCYCQAIKVGQTNHVVCCKCGDRTASFAGQPWPQPITTPYWQPIYPTPYYPTWQPNIITYGDSTNQTDGGYSIRSNSAGALDCTPQIPVRLNQ